jgi:WD40 repeat protein
VTPDGRQAVSASSDQTLKVWDLQTGEELRTLQGHSHGVSSVCVTPDGRHAVSASDDQTLKVWDLQTGRLLSTFTAEEWFTACGISPDGSTVLAGEFFGRLHFLTLAGLGSRS